MKKLIEKLIEKVLDAKVHANHTAIKGKKSTGKEDSGGFHNWKSLTGDNY